MKKQLLLLSFAVCLFLGSQSTFAQAASNVQNQAYSSEATPKMRAMRVIETFSRRTDVSSEQKDAIITLFNDNQRKYSAIATLEDPKQKSDKEAKMQVYIDKQLKGILTEDQFGLYTKSKL
jgi:hypothetical protein